MSAKQAAVRLLESLNEKTRTLFEEGELQRRLEVLYDEITISLKDIDVMKGRFEEIQKQLAETTQPEDNKEIYDDLAEIARDIGVTRERMVANYQLGGVLWEVYDILDSRFCKLEEIEKKLEKHVELILEAQINTIVQLKKKDDELEIDSIKFSDDKQGKHNRVVHCSEAGVTIVRDYDVHAAPPECVGSPTPTRRSVGGRSARAPLIYRETDHSQPPPKKARQPRL
ncbi:hypothetical protein Aduo_005925 [Ancylostoma duodenale]